MMASKIKEDKTSLSKKYMLEVSVITISMCAITGGASIVSFIRDSPFIGTLLLAFTWIGLYEMVMVRLNAIN
jgi:hypothetical protein